MNAARMDHGQPLPEMRRAAALWLRAAEIAPLEEIDPRSVRDRLNRLLSGLNGARSLYERPISTNGGKSFEYNYSLLAEDFPGTVKPEVLRAAIEKYSGRENAEQLALEPVTAAVPQPAPAEQQTLALPFPKEITELHEVRERERPLAEARFRAIEHAIGEAWRKWEGQTIHGISIKRKDDFLKALVQDHELSACGQACLVDWNAINAELAHKTGKRDARLLVSKTTLWTWHGWYKNGKSTEAYKFAPGIAALQDAPTVHAGKSKLFGEPPRTLDFYDEAKITVEFERMTPGGKRLAELTLIEKRSVQMTWEILLRERAELGLPETLSYSAVDRFYGKFPKPLLLWSRGRAKDFHDQCAPYALRDYTTCRVMQWWVLDHGQDDFFVRNDEIEGLDRLTFPELPRDEKLRMWITVVEDVRSRFVLGYAFCATPSSDAICSALRMAVLRTGRAPQFGLIDRGEDFKKVGKDKPKLPQEAQGAFRRLIEAQWGASGQIIFSIGEHPQSKPVERWFGTKRTRFDSQIDSYCGRRPADRPDHCTDLLKQHEQFLLGKREESPLPRASEAIKATAYWIETWYNRQHRHTGQGMGRRTPEEVFRRGYADSERQEALAKLDRNELDVFLRHRESRKVSNGGCVRMFGQEFEPADEKSLGRLFACIGQEVLVAADSHNVGDAVAFDPKTGERLGALQCKKLLAWGADKNSIRANMRHQRRAAKTCREYDEQLRRTYHAPEGAFGFLGQEALRATGTESIRALPPGRPLNFAGAPVPEPRSEFPMDYVKKFGDDFGPVKTEED
jgi:transposase InsO family protein